MPEFVCGTDLISYKNTDETLSTKLDSMDSEIAGKADATDLNGKADANHTHSEYATNTALENGLSGKANATHTHTEYATISDMETLETTVNGKANATHTHNQYATNDDLATLETTVDGKAPANHTHTDYATNTALSEGLASKANNSHIHTQSDITGLETALSDKASVSHTHSNYATTDDVETLETAISGKADTSHTHTQYASTSHTHSEYVNNDTYTEGMQGKADSTHTHAQSDITGLSTELSGKANASHSHAQGDITGLSTALGGKANATHTHSQSDVTGLSTALSGKANTSHTHETTDITGLDTALSGKASATHTHSIDDISETTTKKIMTSAERTKLSGIATGANNYTHPASHPASMITGLAGVATSGSYDDLSDKPTSMTPTAHNHTQSDITGLESALNGKANSSHSHSAVTTSANGFMSASDKTKLDGIATGANKTVVDTALSSTSTNPVQNKVINTALAGKSSTSHNHNSAYIAKSLQMTDDDGDVEVSWSNQDVIAKIKAIGTGVHTAYAKSGTTNNPKPTEAWRYMVHKTGSANFGWVMAFGSYGSVYTGYVDSGTWRGWKCLWDNTPAPLWSGAMYMTSSNSNPQTVTPSKPLSQCRNGWLLLWSDYDAGVGANDSDFVTTMIPKKNPTGGAWGGKAFLCDIPRYIGSDPDNTATEKRIMKAIYVHDNCIKGSYQNASGDRNDVVLRAVYEY